MLTLIVPLVNPPDIVVRSIKIWVYCGGRSYRSIDTILSQVPYTALPVIFAIATMAFLCPSFAASLRSTINFSCSFIIEEAAAR